MMTAKKKKPVKKLKQDWDEKPKKSEIPQNILDEFLKDKIKLPKGTKVREIKCNNLWHDRYRINVWVERHEEESYYPKTWIEYSYFVCYGDGQITDKTIYPKPKKDRFF